MNINKKEMERNSIYCFQLNTLLGNSTNIHKVKLATYTIP